MGIDLGVLCGNLKTGLNLHVHLAAVAGTVNLFVKELPVSLRVDLECYQVWASVDLKVLFLAQAEYKEDKLVLTWFNNPRLPLRGPGPVIAA
jgi:hypothetical protein